MFIPVPDQSLMAVVFGIFVMQTILQSFSPISHHLRNLDPHPCFSYFL